MSDNSKIDVDRLLTSLVEGSISQTDRERLNALVREDNDALEQVVEHLEIESLLLWQHGRVDSKNGENLEARSKQPQPSLLPDGSALLKWSAALAAMLVVAIATWQIWIRIGDDDPGPVDVNPVTQWSIEPTGNASYKRLGPDHVHLERGELLVYSSTRSEGKKSSGAIRIETASGEATARGTRFYVGTHSAKNNGDASMNPITRVLVLAGMVTLTNSAGSVQGQAGELLAAEHEQQPTKVVVQANSEFAFDLYSQLSKENVGKNLFFSPYSVSTALAMVAEGARGETALEMGTSLHFPKQARRVGDDAQLIPWQTTVIHTGLAQLHERFNRTEDDPKTKAIRAEIRKLRVQLQTANLRVTFLETLKKYDEADKAAEKAQAIADRLNALFRQVDFYELSVANSLWGEKTYSFDPAYVATINRHYKTGGTFPADFAGNPDGERSRINDWIAKNTGGKIKDAIGPATLNNLTRLVLANAIYFKGQWLEPFNERATRPRDFTLADGREVKPPTMYGRPNEARYAAFKDDGSFFETPSMVRDDGKDADSRYPGAGGFLMTELPYKGEEVSMVLIAPQRHDGLPELEELLTAANVNRWTKQLKNRKLRIYMPKFSFDSDYHLNETLKQLGMKRVFNRPSKPNGANLSGMFASDDSRERLFVSDVLHKARIEVNEKGTEAAAVTIAVADKEEEAPSVKMIPFTPVFKADRPFVFLIRDTKTGTILFLGRVLEPSNDN